ncbi:MAG: DUF4292 domain-containing protein [Chitinophagaceae bacterium]
MKKYNLWLLSLLCMWVFACRPVRKVQTLNEAITKKDTVQTVVIKETPKIDSTAIIAEMMQKIGKRKIDFNTFNSKIKVDYKGQETNQNVTAYVKMRKDSLVLIKLVGPLGYVAFEVKITKDSVFVVNKIDKYVQSRSISYIQEVTQIPFDFTTLQDLIIGNPIFTNNNVVSYKEANNQLLILMIGDVFKHLITLDASDFKPTHSKLDDIDMQRNRTCDITLGNYENKGVYPFATYRNISVAEKSKLDVTLEFKQYAFNDVLNFSFSIPKNYKRQ